MYFKTLLKALAVGMVHLGIQDSEALDTDCHHVMVALRGGAFVLTVLTVLARLTL
jgi:hypothetical protein